MKVLTKTLIALMAILSGTLLVKHYIESKPAPTVNPPIKSVSGTFLISCDFFDPSDLSQKNDGTMSKNCGSCTTWNGIGCSDKHRLKSHYNI